MYRKTVPENPAPLVPVDDVKITEETSKEFVEKGAEIYAQT